MCVRVPPPPVSLHLAPKRGALLRFRPSCRAAHPTPLFIHAFKSLPLPSGGKEMLPGWMRAIKARTGKAGGWLHGVGMVVLRGVRPPVPAAKPLTSMPSAMHHLAQGKLRREILLSPSRIVSLQTPPARYSILGKPELGSAPGRAPRLTRLPQGRVWLFV